MQRKFLVDSIQGIQCILLQFWKSLFDDLEGHGFWLLDLFMNDGRKTIYLENEFTLSDDFKTYVSFLVLFQIADWIRNERVCLCQSLINIKIAGLGFDLLMVLSMLANATGTKGHEALFYGNLREFIRSWQKLVILRPGW